MFLVELKKCSWTLCVPQCSMIWSLTTSSTAVLITVSLSFPPSPLPLTRSTALSSPAGRALAENTQEELSTFWENETEIKPYILCHCSTDNHIVQFWEKVVYSCINSKNKITFSPWVFVFTCMHLTYAFIQSDLQKRNKAICQRANNARFIRQLLKSRFVLKQCSELEKNKMKQRRWARSM